MVRRSVLIAILGRFRGRAVRLLKKKFFFETGLEFGSDFIPPRPLGPPASLPAIEFQILKARKFPSKEIKRLPGSHARNLNPRYPSRRPTKRAEKKGKNTG